MSEKIVSIKNLPEYEIQVSPDERLNPRKWNENLSIIASAHRRYNLGEIDLQTVIQFHNSWDDVENWIGEELNGRFILPLYLYDHGGLAISTKSFVGRAQHAEWDSGRIGFVYTTDETMEVLGVTEENAAKQIKEEIEEYNLYLQGVPTYRGILYRNKEEIELFFDETEQGVIEQATALANNL